MSWNGMSLMEPKILAQRLGRLARGRSPARGARRASMRVGDCGLQGDRRGQLLLAGLEELLEAALEDRQGGGGVGGEPGADDLTSFFELHLEGLGEAPLPDRLVGLLRPVDDDVREDDPREPPDV